MKTAQYLTASILAFGLAGWTPAHAQSDAKTTTEEAPAAAAPAPTGTVSDEVMKAIFATAGKTTAKSRFRKPGGPWQVASGTGECRSVEPLKIRCQETLGEQSATAEFAYAGGKLSRTVNPGQENEQTEVYDIVGLGFESSENFWIEGETINKTENGPMRFTVHSIQMGDVSTTTIRVQPADGKMPPVYIGFSVETRVKE